MREFLEKLSFAFTFFVVSEDIFFRLSGSSFRILLRYQKTISYRINCFLRCIDQSIYLYQYQQSSNIYKLYIAFMRKSAENWKLFPFFLDIATKLIYKLSNIFARAYQIGTYRKNQL